ncbi:MAG: DNA replication/repair protein RecF [Proteobacteria bacterium]|jgi:DNA replication and repair protein RecF|uniref:DNA replication and repair protein RecF n=2 Tax=Candidatus Fonsibacter lacus TaxID=2576439 RepID=A0A845S7F6_9PROT|nr:DNA replication/repair protein RecF [Candidatus Fonsibacter lacus]NCU48416.1 DNA replication/repair protein RecF [Candidatus Fonsibacter lacus]NCU52704.1 DNA replication/repair protein RecF [Candidatus Fonsibacter lacus]NCU62477.1 DNA replication/repair protein RecF [Candidatus Fonsibacter lacus]NDC43919.1 DNA replication/repair protein RecF [Pseudomonadota bacterium]
MLLIKDIKLQNFRSHSFIELKTNRPIICIIGPNGSGKTNVLEAISLIADKKGIRGALIEDCIKKNSKDKTIISTTISYEKKDYKVDVIFDSKEDKIKKYLNIENNKASLAEVFKDINFIWLTPQMDKIMYEGDSIKRKFLDKIISNYNLGYKKNLNNFKKLSEERIQLLKENKDLQWLNILEKKMIDELWNIFIYRRSFIRDINNVISNKLNNFLKIKLNIKNSYDLVPNINEKEFYEFFKKKYFEKREIDQIIKRNSVGPQFDIFEFFNEETKLNSDLCSTGEQKKILISLILSFILLMKSKNINSILLFDEIASHIDGKNLELFFDEIAKIGMQTWYTGNNIQSFQTIENKAFFVKL